MTITTSNMTLMTATTQTHTLTSTLTMTMTMTDVADMISMAVTMRLYPTMVPTDRRRRNDDDDYLTATDGRCQ